MRVKQFFSWVAAIAVSFGALTHNAQAAETNGWEVISTDDGFTTKRKSVEGSDILAVSYTHLTLPTILLV